MTKSDLGNFSITKNIPVKPHIRKIEEYLADIKKDLGENRKSASVLRSEHQALEHKTKEKCNEITKMCIDDLTNFERELKRVMLNDRSENEFLSQQVNSLNQDKIKLQQNRISIESKLAMCENDVGIDYYK